ncbi:hypothetical protein GQ457_08G035570 [Hibiscus cannabinus]
MCHWQTHQASFLSVYGQNCRKLTLASILADHALGSVKINLCNVPMPHALPRRLVLLEKGVVGGVVQVKQLQGLRRKTCCSIQGRTMSTKILRDATAYWSAEQTKYRKDKAAKIFCYSHGTPAGIVPRVKGIFPYSVRAQNPRTTLMKGTLKEQKRESLEEKREKKR